MAAIPDVQQVPVLPPQQHTVAPVEKQGDSKFDGVLADKARAVEAVPVVQQTVRPVLNAVSHVVRELEQGQRTLDRIIQEAASGKPFSNAELLSLQASMYKYTQELELVSKVVEKGTNGLKDLLKTQV